MTWGLAAFWAQVWFFDLPICGSFLGLSVVSAVVSTLLWGSGLVDIRLVKYCPR